MTKRFKKTNVKKQGCIYIQQNIKKSMQIVPHI